MTKPPTPSATSGPFHQSQTVPLGSFYIKRPVDDIYVGALRASAHSATAEPVHLHGSRQSGKSSLTFRAQADLSTDHVVAVVDLSGPFGDDDMKPQAITAKEFWVTLSVHISLELTRRNDASDETARPDLEGQLATFRREVDGVGFPAGLTSFVRSLDRPFILILDEFDRLGDGPRAEVCRVFRALSQQRIQDPTFRFTFSFVGVRPPVWADDSRFDHEGHERVAGRLLWLDDIENDDSTAEMISRAFGERADPPIPSMDTNHAKAIIGYSGGYPQALSWLGNLVADAFRAGQIHADQSFGQRLREITLPFFGEESLREGDWTERATQTMAWLRTIEHYFLDSAASSPGSITNEALALYGDVLSHNERPSKAPVRYEPDASAHQVLRFSGLARRDQDGGLRLRCPLFADAFGAMWLDKMRTRVHQRELATHLAGRRPTNPAKAKYATDKRLLIIGTGGTIGMAEDDEGSVRPGQMPEWALQAEELFGQPPTIDTIFSLDSANVGPAQWSELANRILRAQRDYDGIVVAHGTDTLAYSASAVAFALGRDLHFPVVFTGSQTTADVLHGDAASNILRSSLVATQDLPEVVVCFGEKIFRATRTQKKDDLRFDGFESPGYPEIGFVAEEVQIFRQSLLATSETSGLLTRRPTEFASGILHVAQMPGSEAAFYEAALDVKDPDGRPVCSGIIISSLGAGNIPNRSDAFDLTRLIDTAKTKGIPVLLTSQYPVLPANYMRYSTSDAAMKAGAVPTGNMTVSAVVTKLSWVLPQVDADVNDGIITEAERLGRIEQMMQNEYVGEGGLAVYKDDSDRAS